MGQVVEVEGGPRPSQSSPQIGRRRRTQGRTSLAACARGRTRYKLDVVVEQSPVPIPTVHRLTWAAVVTLVAIALRVALEPWVDGRLPFLLAYPAVMIAAWYGGLGAGLVSTALSLTVFAAVLGRFHYDAITAEVGGLGFVVSGVLTSALAESLHRTRRRARGDAEQRGRVERALAESQQLAHVGSWELELIDPEDLDKNRLRWSAETFRIFGREPEEVAVTNDLFVQAIHPDDRARIAEAVLTAIRERGQYQAEHRIRRPDGAERHVQEWGTVLVDAAGRPRTLRGTCQDITERKQAELALREQEDLLRLIIDSAPALISYVDSEGRYRLANAAYRRWFGADPKNMVGKHVCETVGEAAWETVRPYMERGFRGEELEYERELRYREGGARWVHVSYSPDRAPSGEVRGVVVLVNDITAAKRAELARQRAAERTERLQQVTAALSVAMTHAEVARAIVGEALPSLGAAAGCVALRDESGTALEVVASDGYAPGRLSNGQRLAVDEDAPIVAAARTRRSVYLQAAGASELGDGRPAAAVSAVPLQLGGRALGAMALAWREPQAFADDDRAFITALARQCAQALERARLYDAEKAARAEAEASNLAKDQFFAVLSHELRTPLTPVLTAAQLLAADATLGPRAREQVAMIRKNVELEARLIDDLLDLTRVSRGKLSLALQAVDAHATIADVLQSCAGEIAARRLTVVTALEAGEHDVEVDQARFQQVIWNVMKNAVKFSREGGRIFVATANEAAGRLTLRIRDEGIGIAPELLPRLFDAFEQGGPDITRRFGGLGLGLAVSRALVEAQGGTIAAESPGVGAGATITITVPLATSLRARPVAHDTARPGPARRLLLVDDHGDTLAVMAEFLELSGYAVKTAGSVAEALRVADQEELDLVVSDIGLPDGTGLELMRELRASRGLRGIALSGYGMDKDVAAARAAGFVDHLTKPVDLDALLAALSRAIARG